MTLFKSTQSSSKETSVLVELTYGAKSSPRYARYADTVDSVTHDGFSFVALPSMEVTVPENTGLLSTELATIDVPKIDDFLERISDGLPHSQVKAKISQIYRVRGKSGYFNEALVLFLGKVKDVIRNPSGRSNRVRFECLAMLSAEDLNQSLSLPVMAQCSHQLGGPGCWVDLALLVQQVVITSIEGLSITTSGGTVSGQLNGFWDNGYIEYQGARVKIRSWAGQGTSDFDLIRQLPASWLNQTVKIVPGCNKTPNDCSNLFHNLSLGGFYGYEVPSFNPLFEVPA